VAKTEAGERELRYSELLLVAEVFEMPPDQLLSASGGGSTVDEEGRAARRRLEYDERALTHRLQAVERDLEDLVAQRDELRTRLAEVSTALATGPAEPPRSKRKT